MLSPVTFIKEVVRETKKVTWPTKKQTQDMTLIVIGASVAIGLYIALLDSIFQKLLANIL
jgi:preprotein translocase SecE subunit